MDADDPQAPFSWTWVAASLVVFTAFELVVGGWVADLLRGRAVSHMLRIRIELVMSLAGYGVGGFVVGLLSPRLRLLEPAVGAALSVVFTFMISWFTPIVLYGTSLDRMAIGALLAFGIGLFGAHLGERVTGR